MRGIHDLGGMEGMGPVGATPEEPVYHAQWEKRAWALFPFGARAGMFGLDEFRNHLEKLHPLHYLTAYYYEHWLEATEQIGQKKGVFTSEEVEERTRHYLAHPDEPLPGNNDPALVEFAQWAVENGFSTARELDQLPRFKIGDKVRVDNSMPRRHHRRPGYMLGRVGEVVMHHGPHVFPDSAGNGLPETAEHLYTIRVNSEEVYGSDDAEPNTYHHVDMWEPYITLVDEDN